LAAQARNQQPDLGNVDLVEGEVRETIPRYLAAVDEYLADHNRPERIQKFSFAYTPSFSYQNLTSVEQARWHDVRITP
jgi:exonuclease I